MHFTWLPLGYQWVPGLTHSRLLQVTSINLARDGFSYFRLGGWINIWGGAAAYFGRGLVATPGKANEKV